MATIATPAEYYEQIIVQRYANAMADAPADVVDQPELIVTFEISGDGGGIYSLRASGKTIEVIPGTIENSHIHTAMTIDDWRSAVEKDAEEPFIGYVRRRKVSAVQSLKGVIRLELARSAGDAWMSITTFGGQTEPQVTLRMDADDYAAMMSGKLSGQMAFMTGKLKFEGNLPLLMQVSVLNG